MLRIGLVFAGDGDDSVIGKRADFAGLADAIAVCVVPDGEAVEFLAAEDAIAVVVQAAQGLVAIVPEAPEGDIAEELQAGGDLADLVRIVDEPAAVLGDPGPA